MTVPSISSSCSGVNSVWCSSNGGGSSNHRYGQEHHLSPTGHLVTAICLGIIGILGFLNNLLVLVLFCRNKVLRSPINLLLMNISVSDLMVCIVGTPFSFAASTQGRWLIGPAGCVWYGFANTLFGTVSLISLAVLSYERYCTMMGTTEADATNYKKVWLGIFVSWMYSLFWTLPPLFGWSSYGPEGPGTTCSVNWHSRDANNVSYIICLFVFCLVLPFIIIVYCYGKLLCAIKQVSGVTKGMAQTREQRVLIMVVVMVICFLLCWLPYGIVALIATFGKPGLVTASASIIPSILAKSSTVYNPVIYIFLNKQFYRCFCSLLKCDRKTGLSSNKGSLRSTRMCCTVPRQDNNFTFVAASAGQPSSEHPEATVNLRNPEPTAPNGPKAKQTVLLVAHYSA
ncbi:vertebrate ancient opsin-like [Podarcis raffonei]|uniref:vertebrate ancient opsin-like n=1 Tax=Podarcis raffonei TaxID=65483 RepID=UPI0023298C26|nr:vertebrate ancient opsin-like [Podarcis raffonei]